MKNLKKIIAVGMTVLVISTASAAALAATTDGTAPGNRYGAANARRVCDGTGTCTQSGMRYGNGTCDGTGVCDGTGTGSQNGRGHRMGPRDGSGIGRQNRAAGQNRGACDGSCTAAPAQVQE